MIKIYLLQNGGHHFSVSMCYRQFCNLLLGYVPEIPDNLLNVDYVLNHYDNQLASIDFDPTALAVWNGFDSR